LGAGFTDRMIRFASRSSAIRAVLEGLVLAEQGYVGIGSWLFWAGPRFLFESAAARLTA
jgi:hypothetical protein